MMAWVCRVAGFILLGLGLWGFVAKDSFLVFEVNPVHHIAQVVLGAAALWASWSDEKTARTFCMGSAAAYGVAALLGFLDVPAVVDLLDLNRADNWLHLLIGGAFLGAVFLSRTLAADGPRRSFSPREAPGM